MADKSDKRWMQRAIELAIASEREGNIPVGAVITLDDEVIAEGQSSVLQPQYNPGRHAEIEAIGRVDPALWPRAAEMTCYSTLEPCLMCAGTLLLHGIGRVVFGAYDELGGAGSVLDHLPPYYDDGGVYDWVGPIAADACTPLYRRADEIFADLPVGRNQWTAPEPTTTPDESIADLERWRASGERRGLRKARANVEEFVSLVDADRLPEVLPYAATVFERTGYLKDFRRLERLAKRAGDPDFVDSVEMSVREHLPDVWILRALDAGRVGEAVECWYEHEDHKRARHCAARLLQMADPDPGLVVSCRMSVISHLIGRRKRKHYRRACAELRRLRDELDDLNESAYWPLVIEDLRNRYDARPALIDELDKAGF